LQLIETLVSFSHSTEPAPPLRMISRVWDRDEISPADWVSCPTFSARSGG
jgi:hypothetical protein